MKKVYTGKDIEALLKAGKPIDGLEVDGILTPSAKDAIYENRIKFGRRKSSVTPSATLPSTGPDSTYEPEVPDFEYRWKPGSDPKNRRDIEAFFNSEEMDVLKKRICEMGHRIWLKGYCDGNGGNISIRVGDNLVLCTPTLISKGFMKPEELCLVDMEGKQLAGRRKATSEIKTHLGIMRYQKDAKSCVHAHPPHATAFAVASVKPPTCMIPEAEVFLGEIGMAEYKTPGSPEVAESVGRMAKDHHSIIMENHGVITWGKDVEDAYWKMENTDAYCQTVWIASHLGKPLHTFTPRHLKDLMAIRSSLGMHDPREGLKECELCDNSDFQPGVVCQVPSGANTSETYSAIKHDPEAEALVQHITDLILKNLKE